MRFSENMYIRQKNVVASIYMNVIHVTVIIECNVDVEVGFVMKVLKMNVKHQNQEESDSLVFCCGNCVSALTEAEDINLNYVKAIKNDFLSQQN